LQPTGHVTLLHLLSRYWRVTVPIMAVAAAGALAVQASAPPDLRAEGAVILASAELDRSRSSESLVHLTRALNDLQREEVAASLTTSDAVLTADLTDRMTLHIGATADRARAAESTVSAAAEWLQNELAERQRQAGISGVDQLAARLLTPTVVGRQGSDGAYVAETVIWIDGLGGAETNPYAPSAQTAQFLALLLSSADGRETVASRVGDGVRFTVRQDPTENLPVLTVTTAGHDAVSLSRAFDEVVAVLNLELEGRQARAQVPPARRIFVEVLARPESALDLSPTVEAPAVMIALSGIVVAGSVAGLLRRRQARRRTAEALDLPPSLHELHPC
jgi:hypothetical protein